MVWTDPPVVGSGSDLTASDFNTYVVANLKAIGDAWTSYTPSWTASTTNPTIGNGSLTGAYLQAGKLIAFRARVLFGTTTTAGSGNYSLSLPVAARSSHRWSFNGIVFDASGPSLLPILTGDLGGSSVALLCHGTTAGSFTRNLQHNVPISAWAAGDEITLSGIYEAA